MNTTYFMYSELGDVPIWRYLILKLLLVITFMEMCRCVLIMILSKYICSILFIAIKLNKWEVCRCADKYLFIKLSNIKML